MIHTEQHDIGWAWILASMTCIVSMGFIGMAYKDSVEQNQLAMRVHNISQYMEQFGIDQPNSRLTVSEVESLEDTITQQLQLKNIVDVMLESASSQGLDRRNLFQSDGVLLTHTDLEALEQQIQEQVSLNLRLKKLIEKARVLGIPYQSPPEPLNEAYLNKLERTIVLHTLDRSDSKLKRKVGRKYSVQHIPVATFKMGKVQPSTVHLQQDFLMMDSEVTADLYYSVLGTRPNYEQDMSLPIGNVTWFEAIDFANRLSEIEGMEPCYSNIEENVQWTDVNCLGWRLPTEAEWEYAARGGENYKYAGSNDIDRVAWHGENGWGIDEIFPVKMKMPNQYGLYDMSGNVWEWVWDSIPSRGHIVFSRRFEKYLTSWVSRKSESKSYFKMDQDSSVSSGTLRITRGGGRSACGGCIYTCSWGSLDNVSNSERYWNEAMDSSWNLGFRLVRNQPAVQD